MRLPLAMTAAVMAALVLPGSAAASVSPRFFGVMANGPLDSPFVDLVAEDAVMRANGVRSMRMPIEWNLLQPYATEADVPPLVRDRYPLVDGIPTDFSVIDRRIAAAARSDIQVTALVLRAPLWAAAHPGVDFSPPRDPATYGKFLATLIGRYGTRGSFWAANPDVPKHPLCSFQIWNEPSLKRYFPVRSFAPSYVKLLRAAYKAVKAADPKSRVITA
ncbi:MAG: hypothetical protein F2813_07405, partial [Actinobacteria bacterium]|nr:hypothetical protein [Actinomycetota bacterium]